MSQLTAMEEATAEIVSKKVFESLKKKVREAEQMIETIISKSSNSDSPARYSVMLPVYTLMIEMATRVALDEMERFCPGYGD